MFYPARFLDLGGVFCEDFNFLHFDVMKGRGMRVNLAGGRRSRQRLREGTMAITAGTARPSLAPSWPSAPSRLSLLGADGGRAELLGSGWTQGRNKRRRSVFSCREFSRFTLLGVFSLELRLGHARCCSCPEVPGSGRPRLMVVTPSRAGSVPWCFPCGGIKRSGLFFDCLPVNNPRGGHLAHSGFPEDMQLPSALRGLRRGLSWKCCWRQLELSHWLHKTSTGI